MWRNNQVVVRKVLATTTPIYVDISKTKVYATEYKTMSKSANSLTKKGKQLFIDN